MNVKAFMIAIIAMFAMTFLAACGDTNTSSEDDNANNQEETDSDDTIPITLEEASETSETFLTHIRDGDYDEAEALYDETMATEMASGDLEAIWDEMETAFGAFTGFDYVDEQQADASYSFIYEGAFGDQSTILNVSINSNKEVAGFYIRPLEE
ncbi:DUF3887 domain-containing protein [Oceanobacillus timonensis]|uniref:DUF3887 domain-containing protein n=1 Tax=Oceanobacillus timonensis TaxID=1926285 RepID=UPI0015C45301|nr:DUF3887 domain-containing protein [Oceanobacillus timonensis]